MLDTDAILDLFSQDKHIAVEKYKAYMNEEWDETFIDLKKEVEVMDEEEARELFQKMLIIQGMENKNNGKVQISDSLIKEIREKTNLSARRIAAITGLNKDKVNGILKS